MNKLNIGIIGANGFIGRHLVDFLSNSNSISLQLFGRTNTSCLNFPYQQIDFSNTKQLEKQFKDLDVIYYLISDSIPASSWENPIFEVENNLIPFLSFLNCVSKLSIKKIIFTSSAGTIYGKSSRKSKENSDKKPFSPHGINKLCMEYYLNYYEAKYNLKYDIFRISNVYGEGQNTAKGLGIINTFIEKIISNNKVTVFGNGEIVRNYIYVRDVAKFLGASLTTDLEKSNIYNLATDDSLSINELIESIKSIITKNFTIDYIETRESDNPIILLNNEKIKEDFPTMEFTPIEQGILNTYNEIKSKF